MKVDIATEALKEGLPHSRQRRRRSADRTSCFEARRIHEENEW
jgi:hypothetical protein